MKWLVKKNILISALVLFLLFAIYLAFSWGNSYVLVKQPHQLMLQWGTKKKTFSTKSWKIAASQMQMAVHANPTNAQYVYNLARLYEWAAHQKPIFHKQAITLRTQAIQHFITALQLRPTWPQAWANLAMSKTLNLEFGDEVKMALANAMNYGVWEKGVFHKVIWISFINWNSLPKALKTQIEQRIKETVTSKGQVPQYIQQTANRFNWQNKLKKIINSKVSK